MNKVETLAIKDLKPSVGIEWTGELSEEIFETVEQFDVIEFIPENFFTDTLEQYANKFFSRIRELNTPILIHGVSMSIASAEPFKQDYFDKVKKVAQNLPVYSFSDHLCMTEMGGIDIGQLTTTMYNDETFKVIADKIKIVQDQINTPFAIENIAHGFEVPGQGYEEIDFINMLQKETGVKLLLDLNNLYSNAVNFGIDAKGYLDKVDFDLVDSIHLAGGFFDDDNFLQDGHSERVPQQVWDLFTNTIQRAGRSIPTIVERTGNNKTGLGPILADINMGKELMKSALVDLSPTRNTLNIQTAIRA